MTVTIYGLGCRSTKKAKQWMINNQIPFVERNMADEPLTVAELQELLRMTTDGTDDIVSKRSLPYRTLDIDFDKLSLFELLELVHEHPRLLKSPLIVEKKKLQVGYNEEEIRQFLPRKVRNFQWLQWKMEHLQPLEG
ncbi:Spx/MgsR family RNA polymerase-binding regulatory protein [Mesobacillus selenatarsenatis]|uniref:Transcriptional regulator Spx n=1 Tax=Mesobacillus selenatarsenatis TaxID=388741 RepID=A0A846TTX5_9BACI|nr:Spx/MgsR family RNA polymerase-binding regulatory protein [Mesobacillus selenatarsenatis]NKE05821.1 transcriptional regulator Spx [Mesobacillus selenatarsenatis]